MNFKALAVVTLLIATAALAATRSRDSNGSPPVSCTDLQARGVSLLGAEHCRLSVRVDGGGNIEAGKLVPYYCDAVLAEPVELTSSACTIGARLDAGLRTGYACDITPGVRNGFLMTVAIGVTGRDGGIGAAALADAGPSSLPVFRTECEPVQ